MLLIHQMLKVASRSWVEAGRERGAGAGEELAPVHCHYIVPRNRERIAAAFAVPAAQQTIANMLMPRNLLRAGGQVWGRVQAAQQRHERIRVITGMRDPVARSVSLI